MSLPAAARALLFALVFLGATAGATDEVRGERVRVLFDDPALAGYAARVAATADEALLEVAELFGVEPPRVVLRLEHHTDVFNAFAPLLPRPSVSLRPLVPLRGELGFGVRDPLRLLLLHELTHDVQLSYTALPPGTTPPPRIGLVGEGVAPPPPLWFVEGIATWVESTLSPGGGRLQDARTRGLLDSLAFEGNWPGLDDAGLTTYAPWPGGQTRYLVGAGFIAHLVETHGFAAVPATLREFNAGGPTGDFAGAWRRAVGSDLGAAWEDYRDLVAARAAARAAEVVEVERLTDSAGLTATPAVSPDGEHLAWTTWPPGIAVAALGASGLEGTQVVRADVQPLDLDWLDDTTLVYTAIDRRPGSELAELFLFDLASGRERRLTGGARAVLVSAGPGGCLWYARVLASEGSSVRRLCPQGDGADWRDERVWRAPAGVHVVGLDVAPGGRVALSLWRAGQVDLALLVAGEAVALTADPAHDTDPVWDDESTLLFASDRSGVYELHSLRFERGAPARLSRLTASLGGAFWPAGGGSGVFVELHGAGYDLARLAGGPVSALPLPAAPAGLGVVGPDTPIPPERSRITRYEPLSTLSPYGWLPSDVALEFAPFRVALAVDIVGQDDSGDHSYALTAGYDTALDGALGGAHLALRYGYRDSEALANFDDPAPFSAGVRVGVWPYRPHLGAAGATALGAEVEANVRLSSDPVLLGRFRVGLVRPAFLDVFAADLRADLVLSRQFADPFGYRTRGGRLVLSLVSGPSPAGRSSGAWVDGSLFVPTPFGLPGTGELAVRAGWRQAPPIPLELGDLAAVATLGYRRSFGLGWRYGDGRYAVERLSVEGRLRGWYDGAPGLGGDVALWADTVVWYAAPVSVGGTLGYARGWWGGLGLRLGF